MFFVCMLAIFPPLLLAACLAPFRTFLSDSKKQILLLGVLTLVFVARFLFSGEIIVQKDANLLQIPFLLNYRESVWSNLEPPLWNSYLSLGVPSLAHPLYHVLHPTTSLALLLPVNHAFNAGLTLTLFLSCCTMFLFMRELGLGKSAGLVASVVYGFNEFTLDRLGAPDGPGVEYLYTYAVVPLSLALLLRAVSNRSVPLAVLFGVSLAFVLNGNPSLFYYGVLLLVVWSGCQCLLSPSRSRMTFTIVAFVVGILVLFLVDAVEVLPLRDLQSQPRVSGSSFGVAGWRIDGVSLGELGNLFAPHLPRARFAYAGRLGWIGLALALLALSQLRLVGQPIGRRVLVPAFVLIAMALLLVTRSPLFELMRDWTPLFGRIGMVPSVFILVVFPLSVLAGIGSRQVFRGGNGVAAVLGILAFVEMFGASSGWPYSPRFTVLRTYRYVQELRDFPHLAAVARASSGPHRIDCATEQYRMICPDYAVMSHGLRLIRGEGTQGPFRFPREGIRDLVSAASENRALLGVKFVLSPHPLEEPGLVLRETIRWTSWVAHKEEAMQVYVREYNEGRKVPWDGTVYVYETGERQEAFLVDANFAGDSPRGDPVAIDVTRIGSRLIEVNGVMPRRGILLLGEPYYPGWKATVDGRISEVVDLSGGLIGVPIGEGRHSIALRYDPLAFTLGFWISLLGVLSVLLVTLRSIQLKTAGF